MLLSALGRVWMARVQTKVRPRGHRRGRKNEKKCFLRFLRAKYTYLRGFLMVDFDDLGSPRGSLGALGSVLGGPGSSRVGFRRARGGPEEQGTAFGGSREGSGNAVWRSKAKCICAKDTFLRRFLMIFDNYVFSACRKKRVGHVFFLGCFRVLWVHGPSQESASTFFLAPGGPFGAAKARTMTIFEVNPAVELKVLFFDF